MLAIGNDELKGPIGDTIHCKQCGSQHLVQYGDRRLPDGTLEPSRLLAFYTCGDHSYLCGIAGRSLD